MDGDSKVLLEVGSGPRGRPTCPQTHGAGHELALMCVFVQRSTWPLREDSVLAVDLVRRWLVWHDGWKLTLQGLLAPLGLPCKLCPVDALLCEEWGRGGLWVALTSLPDVSPALQEGHA